MPDNKPKPSTIAKIAAKALIPGVGLPMAARDIASRISLSRMAENLNPYDYTDVSGRSAIERFFDAVVLNKKEAPRQETEQYIEKGYGLKPDIAYKERVDLLQMLAGKPQKYNTIAKSKYTPDIEPEKGTQYYSSKGIEDEIINNLDLSNKTIKSEKDLENIIKEVATNKGKRGYVARIPGLGDATYNLKRDAKGLYLDYRDVWDLNPREGVNRESEQAGYGMAENLMNLAKTGLRKAGTFVVNATATPANVYGRIYFDPKTGKPIRQK